MQQPGQLLVIEGGDGSGKQTQTKLLVERLQREAQRRVMTIDFPQYQKNMYGAIIRDYLDGRYGPAMCIDPNLAGLLYCVDRYESAPQIRDWLERGDVVVSDRYHTANIIHQGAKAAYITGEFSDLAFDLTVKWLANLEFKFLKNPTPDLILYLHVYPEVARLMMEKQGRQLDEHEANLEYAQQVEQTALRACQKFGWIQIECCPDRKSILPIEEIHELIWNQVKPLIKEGDSL